MKKNKELVFIDDSGDPGFKDGASDNFVIAAVLFLDSKVAESLMYEVENYRKALGWKYNHEFKFTKTPKRIVVEMLRYAKRYNFKIYAVYIRKKDFREITPSIVPLFDKEKLYNWMIKEVLRDIPLENAKITIDGRSSKQHQRNTITYLRHEINSNNSKKLDFKFDDSVTTDLLQLADLIAGSINRSLQLDKTDSRDYITIFKDKIIKIRKISVR